MTDHALSEHRKETSQRVRSGPPARVEGPRPWRCGRRRSAALIPTIRAVASDLAARADFDLDAISDLRMAVDEACATLVDVAAPSSVLRCTFLVRPERIEVHAEVQAGRADDVVSTDTFGWRVLQTLADDVTVHHSPASDGNGPTVGIRLDKRAGDAPR